METMIGVAVGIGLSAACGFRVFVPLLIMNLAALSGHLQLPADFAWIGNVHATVAFGTATILEALGYYLPGVDHVLDVIATPAAVIAGTITTVSMVVELSPLIKWTLALIAGGGIAGLIQGSTVVLRAKSSAATAGTGNFLVASMELAAAVMVAFLAVLLPVLSLMLIVFICIVIFWKLAKVISRGKPGKNSNP